MNAYSDVTISPDGEVSGLQSGQGGIPVRFSGPLDLLWISMASDASGEAADAIWELQDGYGEPGYTPVQGWDWSGIRDSTVQARAAMFDVARSHLSAAGVADALGVDREVVASAAAAYLEQP